MSETDLNAAIRLAIGGRDDVRLSRNNSGRLPNPAGRWVQFGVFSPGGPDIVGIRRRIIRPDDVGSVIGQFVGIESKVDNRKSEHRKQQEKCRDMILRFGGVAGFVFSVDDAEELLR